MMTGGGIRNRAAHPRAPSPRLRGEGRGEGAYSPAQTRGKARSPGSLRDPTSPRARGEVLPLPNPPPQAGEGAREAVQ